MIDIKNIVLIGMPGCGKSTIGRLLAQKLGADFFDADELLAVWEGKSIEELFVLGEEVFRSAEIRTIARLAEKEGAVIATGGGVVKKSENMERLKATGIIVFIDRDVEAICSDIELTKRPLLALGYERVRSLYDERIELYRNYGNIVVRNEGPIEEVVDKIILAMKRVEQ